MHSKGFLSYENKVLALMSLTFGFVMFDRVALNMLLPFIAPELHLNNIHIGLLASALGLAWAISGVVVAGIADRQQSRKKWFVAMVALFSVASISSGLTVSFMTLFITRLLLGLAEGPVLPLAQTIMAAESSAPRRGFNLGVLQNFGSSVFGNLLAPVALIWLANQYNWRMAFFIASVPGLLLAALCLFHIREPAIAKPSSASAADKPLGSMALLRLRNIPASVIMSCCMVTWLVVQLIFLPIYLTKVRGMAPTDMAWLLSIAGVSAVIASLFVSRLSDVIGRKPTLVIFSLLAVVGPACVVTLDASIATLALPLFIANLGCGCLPQAIATVPSESTPPAQLASVVALITGISEIAGGVLAPVVAGILAEQVIPSAPLLLAGGAALISAVTALTIQETAPLKLARLQRKAAVAF